MSVIGNPLLLTPEGYQISRSVRLRSSASAYFNRTPASAGNRKTWTWSSWIKRGKLGASQTLFEAKLAGSYNRTTIVFGSNDTLYMYAENAVPAAVVNVNTVAVFRDTSAWYHVVVAFDTTQATANDRTKIYVNGVQQTLTYTTNPSLNTDYAVNATDVHNIGRLIISASEYTDGYLTEINFIDGQALTPSSFGETDSITGVWKPKKYAGTYGTNGFYLNFSDPASTTTIGYDYSGNGNNWTSNNISVTAGVTYDSMIDTPTPYADGGNGRGNYCTLNPLDKYNTNGTISDGNLAFTSGNVIWFAGSTMAISTKMYTEITVTAKGTNDSQTCGIAETGLNTATLPLQWNWSVSGNRLFLSGVASGVTMPAVVANDVIGFAVDPTAKTCAIYLNNSLITTATYTTSKDVCIFVANGFTNGNWSGVINFGQRPFAYTPPTGFKALNTQNLPEPTIVDGGEYFNPVLYTGNGTSQSVTGVGFQPDFVWLKARSNAQNHTLYDAVRGATKYLISNATTAETTNSETLKTFDSDGFSLGNAFPNDSGYTYVAWNWKANGAGVSNTDGSITSTVSAGVTQGFSVVTYTGTLSSAGTATVGHGLGVAPSLIISKSRTNVSNWVVHHPSLTNANYATFLNLTNAQADTSGNGSISAPTSSVFTTNWTNGYNEAGNNYVAYCFAEVPGFSKFGSYTGNGSADGPFVFTGFRPRWVMFKRTDTIGDWVLLDTSRDTFNAAANMLFPNLSNAETNVGAIIDFLSNGFKLRFAGGASVNASGGTYIYMAFAEHPFKNALAR